MSELTLKGGEFDGLRLHYVAEGSGPPLLLLHGLGGFAESWRHNLPVLSRRLSTYALDLPGFGLSGKPPVAYRLSFFVRAVDAVVESLGLAQTALVGHSLGGAVAVAYAMAHPSKVNRLVLIGAVVPGFGYRMSWVYRLIALRGIGDLLARLAWPGLFRFALARCFAAADPEEVDFLVRTGYAVRASPEGRAAYLSTLREVRNDFVADADFYRRGLETLEIPALWIHGRQDPVVSPAHALLVADRLKRGTMEWVDRCGHFPQIEDSDRVNRLLLEFLVPHIVPAHAD